MLRWLDYLWAISDGPIIRPRRSGAAKGFTFGDWIAAGRRQPQTAPDHRRRLRGDDVSLHLDRPGRQDRGCAGRDRTRPPPAQTGRGRSARRSSMNSSRPRAGSRTTTRPPGRWPSCTAWCRPNTYEAGKAYFRQVVEDADGLIGTGFIGTPALLPALTLHGMADLAEKTVPEPQGAGLALSGRPRRHHDLGTLGRAGRGWHDL